MATMTFNPSTGGDGLVSNSNATYSTAHDAASGTEDQSTPNTCAQNGLNAGTYYVGRGFFPFDTSGLPDDATIVSAKLRLYITGIGTGAKTASIVQSTQASNTNLDAADFDQVGTTIGGTSVAYSSMSTSAYTEIDLNATGLTWISKTGYTPLALRQSDDISNTAPADFQYIQCNYSDSVSNKPELVVIYTTPEAGGVYIFN